MQDVQGRKDAQQHVFILQQLPQAHYELAYGMPIDPNGLPEAVREKVLDRITRAKAAR